ncbi:MAG TPA: GAF domain-containing sensor histidine kinase [Armatimonadota bacterium]|jgi:signal transduction histidine kinase
MSNRVSNEPILSDASDVITDLALAINQGLGVQDVQQLVVEKAVAALRGSSASVMLPGDGPGSMQLVATTRPEGTSGAVPPESPVAEWVVANDEPMLLLGRSGPLAHLLHREDIRDAVCVPLRYAGRAIGALSVSNSDARAPFDEGDVALLTSIGHLAAVALQNTMLYDEACEHRERLQAVLHQLWNAQENERKRVAADLHDGPAQGLFNLVFRVQTARRQIETDPSHAIPALDQAEETARETLIQLRAVMAGLRPMSLDDLGLVPALRNECAAVTARGRVNVEVTVTGEPRRLSSSLETGLYHITREALINVERHSGSARARMEMHFTQKALTITVEDWGKGFGADIARSARNAGRIGLAAMRERADAHGITLATISESGKGTLTTLRCPLTKSGKGS